MDDSIQSLIDQKITDQSAKLGLAFSLANMNAINAITVVLSRKGVIDSADLRTINQSFKGSLDMPNLSDNPIVERILQLQDKFTTDLIEILKKHDLD